jgi:hypothetical protein
MGKEKRNTTRLLSPITSFPLKAKCSRLLPHALFPIPIKLRWGRFRVRLRLRIRFWLRLGIRLWIGRWLLKKYAHNNQFYYADKFLLNFTETQLKPRGTVALLAAPLTLHDPQVDYSTTPDYPGIAPHRVYPSSATHPATA